MRTMDAAVGRWRGILGHFGIDAEYLSNRHGPCPMCGGKDRWRFDDKDGAGTWFCNGCGSGDGMGLLMRIRDWDFGTAAREVDAIVGRVEAIAPRPPVDPVDRLRRIAQGLVGMDSVNPVRLYLRSRRLPVSKAIHFHPGLAYYEDGEFVATYPAMVCRFESATTMPLTYHVTYLAPDGEKAPVGSAKKLMPPRGTLAGGAIRLAKPAAHIGIAEGIETALAVMRDFQVPCWAAANTTLLERFDPPDGVQAVTVFADHDANYAGQKAAYTLANRLFGRVAVDVRIPAKCGSDFADLAPGETRTHP